MVKPGYVPRRGDLVWLDFAPHAGHEQGGRRPALVISRDEYNRKVGLLLACPITSRKKGYPFEVDLPERLAVAGVILVDQIRNLDWKARNAKFIDRADADVVERVLSKFSALMNG